MEKNVIDFFSSEPSSQLFMSQGIRNKFLETAWDSSKVVFRGCIDQLKLERLEGKCYFWGDLKIYSLFRERIKCIQEWELTIYLPRGYKMNKKTIVKV